MRDSRLSELKAGDPVVIRDRFLGMSLSKVDRVTKTMIVAANSRWKKDSGYRVGALGFDRARILVPTDEMIRDIKFNNLLSKVNGYSIDDYEKLSACQLESIVKIVESGS